MSVGPRKEQARQNRGPRKQAGGAGCLEGSSQAKRWASVILEVLGGLRSPTDASQEMGVSLPRYYTLETRAIQGFVLALEPRPRGRRRDPEGRIACLSREKERLERELLRAQALVRLAQRTMGIAQAATSKADGKKSGKAGGRRKRRPRVRVRRIVRALRHPDAPLAELGQSIEGSNQDSAASSPQVETS